MECRLRRNISIHHIGDKCNKIFYSPRETFHRQDHCRPTLTFKMSPMRLAVTPLSRNVTIEHIREIFGEYGKIIDIFMSKFNKGI